MVTRRYGLIVTCDPFGWIALEDLASVGVMLDKDGKLLHILEFIATRLGVIDLTSYVGVAITIEYLTSLLLLTEYLDVSFGQSFACCSMSDLQFTILLEHSYFELVGVESKELLQIT